MGYSPFDYVKSITTTKDRLEVDKKGYIPFVVNRAVAHHKDCILYANEMNLMNSIDIDIQYEYLINTIRKRKRKFIPWQKNIVKGDTSVVMKYFDVGFEKSLEIIDILTVEQIDRIKELYDG